MIRSTVAVLMTLAATFATAQAAGFKRLWLYGITDAGFGGNEVVLVAGDYRWSPSTGAVYLGSLPDKGGYVRAKGVSDDGSVVVGEQCCGSEGFKWTEANGMTRFGSVGNSSESDAEDASADGSAIVGMSARADGMGGYVAVRWTEATGMVALGHLPGKTYVSAAQGVSADGTVVVGTSSADSSSGEAFRWTQSQGMTGLGDLPGGQVTSNARGVSDDGRVVVGYSYSANGPEAFRWTPESGIVGLGFLPGSTVSYAYAVSGDGSIIGGESPRNGGNAAFIWTPSGGMQELRQVLVVAGLAWLSHWNIGDVLAISADGQWIAGNASDASFRGFSFVANLSPTPPDSDEDGVLDGVDNCVLAANADQRDTDGDGYGNLCDADLDGSGMVTTADYTILRNRLNTSDADADLNGSGKVTIADYTILRNSLNSAPGPSGLHP